MSRARTLLLLLPAILVIGIFMAIPMLVAVAYSFLSPNPYGGVEQPWTVAAYVQLLFERDFDDTLLFTWNYLIIIARSVWLAAATTLLSLLIGGPVAWFIVCQPKERQKVLLFLVTLPFWINMLIRTYCWVVILRDQGLLNQMLRGSGIIGAPLPLLYNDGAILLGLVYTFLPFMVLPIYSTLERIDTRLIEAAHDLYASRFAVWRRVIWPLARPGAAAGALLVFAPALGSFLAPDLLGGGRNFMIGSLIQAQFGSARNWPFGAALAVLMAAAVLIVMIAQMHRSRKAEEARS